MRARRILGNLALLVTSVAVAVIIGEVALRMIGLDWTASMMTNDRELGWALRPGSQGWFLEEGKAWVEINSDGMRDFERKIEKSPEVVRIAVLGDSTAESRQVDLEQSWTALLERKLRSCPKLTMRKIEVLNFGVGGYGTAQELIMLEKKAWKYDPDVVLLAFYPGNDLYNNIRELNPTNPDHAPYYLAVSDGTIVLDDSFSTLPDYADNYVWFKDMKGELLNSSRLLRGLFHAYTHVGRAALDERRRIDENSELTLLYYPPGHPNSKPAMEEAWTVTEKMLLRFRDQVESRGKEAWITSMTVALQVHSDPADRETFIRELGVSDLYYPNRRLERFAEQHELNYIEQVDALAAVAQIGGNALHGFKEHGRLNDGHLNQLGHVAVAEVIGTRLCREGFGELAPVRTAQN